MFNKGEDKRTHVYHTKERQLLRKVKLMERQRCLEDSTMITIRWKDNSKGGKTKVIIESGKSSIR